MLVEALHHSGSPALDPRVRRTVAVQHRQVAAVDLVRRIVVRRYQEMALEGRHLESLEMEGCFVEVVKVNESGPGPASVMFARDS